MGVGLLSGEHAVPSEAELSVLVSDRFQRQGLGTVLLERLLEIGRAEGLHRITADILFDNRPVQRLFKKLGFHLRRDHEEGVVKADLDLYQAVQPKFQGLCISFRLAHTAGSTKSLCNSYRRNCPPTAGIDTPVLIQFNLGVVDRRLLGQLLIHRG
ncbi:MAG TPA: GNAT family N-acetyltransferase [Rubrobacteraceae bacterium]|nr:GNAT family N-acetyltransferase [Rubrobacteraceae bacterium]